MSDYEEFLAGDRPGDVAFFLHGDAIGKPEALAAYAHDVEDGVVLVLPGEEGRSAFESVAGIDPMALASEARQNEGEVEEDLAGGGCPSAENGAEHDPKLIFGFVEAQNAEYGGLYAEGDVMHAYASCECGCQYYDKWVVEA